MDFDGIIKTLTSDGATVDTGFLESSGKQLADQVKSNQLKLVDLVRNLNQILTSTNHQTRNRGLELLVNTVTQLNSSEINPSEIDVLFTFICLRLVDHQMMEEPSLRCLIFFVGCSQRPPDLIDKILEFLQTKIQARKMLPKSRYLVYELLKKIIEKESVKRTIKADAIYAFVQIAEGESYPSNIMLCFKIVRFIMVSFDNIEPFLEDLFDWLSSYYPIDYTPDESGGLDTIRRSDLVEALYACFFASDKNSHCLLSLLVEKLDSNILSSKLESLNCLVRCFETFSTKTIERFCSSVWAFIRTECLKRREAVDSTLLSHCLKALAALSQRISENNEFFLDFASNTYDELSMAFKKPELQLFEPAALLFGHLVQAKISGFNFLLEKILPYVLNAVASNELRPVRGVACLFEQLAEHHKSSELCAELNPKLNELTSKLLDRFTNDADCHRFLSALIIYGAKLDAGLLDAIVERLITEAATPALDLEQTLCDICRKFGRTEVFAGLGSCPSLEPADMLRLVHTSLRLGEQDPRISVEFSVILRVLISTLDESERTMVDSISPKLMLDSLDRIRQTVPSYRPKSKFASLSGRLHAIVINKIDEGQVDKLVMPIFSSPYCQELVTNKDEELSKETYIPFMQWILKSLALRNHKFALPLINLVLNFIESDVVGESLALVAARIFSFVLEDHSSLFSLSNHFRIFVVYQQKFFTQVTKEIRVRYDREKRVVKRHALLCTFAIQIPKVPAKFYKGDCEWLLRELLVALETLKSQEAPEELVGLMLTSLENLIGQQDGDKMTNFLQSLAETTINYARVAKSMNVRRLSLNCLARIPVLFREENILALRAQILRDLRACLSDRKRLVRQVAGEARLRWTAIGQPKGNM